MTAALPLLAPTAGMAQGVIRSWTNTAGGLFNDPANWLPLGVPGPLDTALIEAGTMYSISFSGSVANEMLVIDDLDLTFVIPPLTSYSLHGAVIGDQNTAAGRLTFAGGTLAVTLVPPPPPPNPPPTPLQVRIGKNVGAVGELFVSNGAIFTSEDLVLVGDGGSGLISITNGGTVSLAATFLGDDVGASGTVNVDGLGSSWSQSAGLSVGNNGTGTVSILNSGSFSSTGFTRIGDNTGSVGTVTVDGPGSTFTTLAGMSVGNNGTGTFNLINGATAATSRVSIGDEIGSLGSFMVIGPTATWTDSVRVIVGNLGNGSLLISNGATPTGITCIIGQDLGGVGHVTVTGPGTSFTNSSELRLGLLGTGSMTVTGGASTSTLNLNLGEESIGTLSIEAGSSGSFTGIARLGDLIGSDGTLNVTGAGATADFLATLFVGNFGAGTMNVTGGGTVTTPAVFVADDLGSTGDITISGAGSNWTASASVVLGNTGVGTMNVLAGGSASWAGLGRIGDNFGATGSLTVDGVGSSWTCLAESFIGNFGTGSLSASNGATINTARVKVGDEPGSLGTATVDGAGTTWTDSLALFVGNFGTGSMTISGGASVSSLAATIGDNPLSAGSISVSGAGSTLSCSGALTVANFGTGTLTVSGGGAASAASVAVNQLGTVAGDGTVWGNMTSLGIVSPGLSVGELTLQGTYIQAPTGHLATEVSCTGADRLTITGNAVLGGTLDVSFVPGSEPFAGQQFTILSAPAVIGSFAIVNAPLGVVIDYQPSAVVLTVTKGGGGGPLVGDLDGNGIVDVLDLLMLLGQWGTCTPPCPPSCPGDLNDDCVVDVLDLLGLLANWGATGGCP